MAIEINPKDTTRDIAFDLWMKAPNSMVTFFKTLDVTNLVKLSKKKNLKFNMLIDFCIGKVIKALMNFLDLDDEVSDTDKVDAYTLFVSELYKTSEESLSDYVKKIVFESENIYVKLKGKGEVPSTVLKKASKMSLKHLMRLHHFLPKCF